MYADDRNLKLSSIEVDLKCLQCLDRVGIYRFKK